MSNDIEIYNQLSNIKNSQYKKKYKEEFHRLEELSKNIFDLKIYKKFNYITSRKNSKDSSNISTQNEDFFENEYYEKDLSPYKSNNNNCFKGKALDFKIKYKTELCKFYQINGNCKYGDNCAYAHGLDNLRSKVTNSTTYRTRKCIQFFEKGYCPYGSRCQFKHQLISNIANNPYDEKITYKKILETLSKFENVENIKKLNGKPRLQIFKEIINNPDIEAIESRLLEDIKSLNNEKICYKK